MVNIFNHICKLLCVCILVISYFYLTYFHGLRYISLQHYAGVMPAVKRREIQRRRARRERLWRDDDDNTYSDDDDDNKNEGGGEGGNASSSFGVGGGALKRAAKKILVRQLKEIRENQARMMHRNHKRQRKNEGDDDYAFHDDETDSDGGTMMNASHLAVTSTTPAGGALADGFTLDDGNLGEADKSTAQLQPQQHIVDGLAPDPMSESGADYNQVDIITINSDEERDPDAKLPASSTLDDTTTIHQHELLSNDAYESDNDWEMARAVQLSMNDDSIQHRHQKQPNSNPFEQSQHQQINDIEAIASLPNEARYQWIDSQWKAQRIQSRRECIQAAANPEDYSEVQLRNFYKSNALAKRVGEISKLVETRKDEFGGGVVDGDDGGEGSSVHRTRPSLQRLRRHNQENSSTDNDDDDNEMFGPSTNYSGASMKVLFGEDDSDEDNEIVHGDEDGDCVEEGGFLLTSAGVGVGATIQKESEIEVLPDDSDCDDHSQQSGAGGKSTNDILNSSLGQKSPTDEHCIAVDHGTRSSMKKLHELCTAEQEWAGWGGEVDNETSVGSTKNAEVLDSSGSESDEDGVDGTFLTVGRTPKPLDYSNAMQNVSTPVACAATVTNAIGIEVDDADEDDVDWEDGDSNVGVNDASNSGRSNCEVRPELNEATTTCDDDFSALDDHSSVDDVARVDTNKHSRVIEIPSDHDDDERLHDLTTHLNPSEPRSSFEVNEPLEMNYSGESPSENEFNSIPSDGAQAAALQRAQATASNFTSWAGRAFQRAISTLTTHPTHPDSNFETNQREVTAIDLTTDHDGTVDISHSDNPATGTGQEENYYSPAMNHSVHRKQVLFDTSLQGLTDAHNAIIEEEKTMERDMSSITDEMKADILELLQLCGIPWIESPSEAEAQCAALEELGLVDGVVTEDSDIFVFGGRKVYKNFFNEQKYVEAYFAKDIERDLALKKHQLVALAMLLGGDYTDGVKGVGIVNGMEILQAFPIDDSEDGVKVGLQRFREWLDGFEEPSLDGYDDDVSHHSHKEYLFHKKHRSARTRWVAPVDFPSSGILNAYLKPVVDISETKFTWATPDLQCLQSYCAETIGWESAETDRVVNPVLKVLESGSKQTRIESYFMKYEDGIKFANIRSKRLKAVLTDIQRGEDENEQDIAEHDVIVADEDAKPKKKRRKK
jgi:hypothetical protein